MEEYIDEILTGLPEDMNGVATTPAADHLFKTRSDAPKLNKERTELFHRITAQIIFLARYGRPDLRTVISLLTKQVREDKTDEDDYKKLTRVTKYMCRTKFLCLTIEATYLDQNHWFIDATFAIHDNMRSHTGTYVTFAKGMIDGSEKRTTNQYHKLHRG